jgi:hypothetical protein
MTVRFPREIALHCVAFSGSCTSAEGRNWKEWAWDLARGFAAADGQPLGQSMLLCSMNNLLGPVSEIALL